MVYARLFILFHDTKAQISNYVVSYGRPTWTFVCGVTGDGRGGKGWVVERASSASGSYWIAGWGEGAKVGGALRQGGRACCGGSKVRGGHKGEASRWGVAAEAREALGRHGEVRYLHLGVLEAFWILEKVRCPIQHIAWKLSRSD